MNNQLISLLHEKPYLTWFVKNKSNLSDKSILEFILNYGNWDDYLVLEKAFGIDKTNLLFKEIKEGKRVNLREKTVNYFEKYFQKYA